MGLDATVLTLNQLLRCEYPHDFKKFLQHNITHYSIPEYQREYKWDKDQNIEELADLMEVIYAAAIVRGYTLEQLEQVRAEKAAKRGRFAKKILLKEVIEK